MRSFANVNAGEGEEWNRWFMEEIFWSVIDVNRLSLEGRKIGNQVYIVLFELE